MYDVYLTCRGDDVETGTSLTIRNGIEIPGIQSRIRIEYFSHEQLFHAVTEEAV
jgi:hypothetical protein